MDTATAGFLGAAIGGGMALLGTIVSNVFTYFKEKHLWEREQEAEREKAEREEHAKFKERLREVYGSCLHHTAIALLHRNPGNGMNEEEVAQAERRRSEALKWVAQLVLLLPVGDKELEEGFIDLSMSVNLNSSPTALLRNAVIRLAKTDARLQ